MRILLCGEKTECQEIKKLLFSMTLGISDVVIVDDYEEIHCNIVDIMPSAAIVCDKGAKGMETVYRIKESNDLPIIWFSDDKGFAVHSYRLGCSYFGLKPISSDSLKKAFAVIR